MRRRAHPEILDGRPWVCTEEEAADLEALLFGLALLSPHG